MHPRLLPIVRSSAVTPACGATAVGLAFPSRPFERPGVAGVAKRARGRVGRKMCASGNVSP